MSDPPEDDPWASGRAATAEEVKAIFARHRTEGPALEHHDALPAFVRLPRFLLGLIAHCDRNCPAKSAEEHFGRLVQRRIEQLGLAQRLVERHAHDVRRL